MNLYKHWSLSIDDLVQIVRSKVARTSGFSSDVEGVYNGEFIQLGKMPIQSIVCYVDGEGRERVSYCNSDNLYVVRYVQPIVENGVATIRVGKHVWQGKVVKGRVYTFRLKP